MSRLDVLVVGGGPAGSVAATLLARAGLRVRLIDRDRFPRPKLCGDTLNPGALALLQRVDGAIESGVSARLRARATPVTGMIVSGPGGACVSAEYPSGIRGLSISRSELDLLLIEQAAAAGVDVVENVRGLHPVVEGGRVTGVQVQTGATETERWSARLVVVADGRGSRLAAALRLAAFARHPRRWAFGAYFSGVSGTGTRGEMHLRPDGYVGVSPLPDGLTNVCVVRPSGRRVDQRTVINEALVADEWLRDRFATARQESPVLVLGPLAVEARAAGCPGALLAGDAAGFVDPMTGDGVRFALGGGRLAADAALSELATGVPACAALLRARQRAFAGKWRFNRALRTLAGSPRGLTVAAWLGARWNAPVQRLIYTAADLHETLPLSPADRTAAMHAHSRAW